MMRNYTHIQAYLWFNYWLQGGGRNLLSSKLNRPLLGRQHSVFLHVTI
ncbi:unnamed protein product [Acanthoscelides obtectus]|uniref:Uncharacterized protein n=1 Tax=Acanthoscelides obtectus TaxID=200917 RepID=A0A9P0MC86_ACAOB|nr:unnamed protein product [Acanthoscelides obtectus]CAK1659887.1 hypothetical protein AOBTE_LOCUS21730 [Acanthoscelides obtectus]